jgi:hypothetical protein
MEYKEFDDKFLFESDPDQQKEEMSFLQKRTKNQDGLYRPTLEEASDPKVGYKSRIRFLKNATRGGKIGPASIEKHVHYVAKGPFDSYPELVGYYDCEKNYKEKCELCTQYWKLKKSKNQADVEKAELISRNTKYYSYVMILEDVQHPELVGKIMVFSYGYKIKEKINLEYTGEVSGVPCNVFDFAKGKDFTLIIKENKTPQGTFPNYDNSAFLETSPLKIYNEKKQVFIPVQLDQNGEISDSKWQNKIRETLLGRDEKVNIEDHMAKKDWTDEERDKVDKIISVLRDGDIEFAEQATSQVRNTNPSIASQPQGQSQRPQQATPPPSTSNVDTDMDEFFNFNSDK